MRVIGGSAKGRRLRSTRARDMRPTTDMLRRVIFDILGDRADDAVVLDLFAGAGTLGIEALSRGASRVTFVERDAGACDAIRANLEATGFAARAVVVRSEVARFLGRRPGERADLVFLDPPYGAGLAFVGRVLGMLAAGDWVREDGTVVVEAEVGSIEWPTGFREIRVRRAGRTQMSMAVHDGKRTGSDLPGHV